MIVLDLSILNQKGTPMFNSDLTANRPAAGIVGRIFIAIDSPYGIFRDTGTAWDQISSAGGGAVTTIYNGDGTLTGTRTISSGGFELVINPQTTFFSSLTASTSASSFSVLGSNALSFAAGFSSSNIGNVYGANGAINAQNFLGNATFAQANLASAMVNVNKIDFGSGGHTITMTQSTGIRAMTGVQNQIQFTGSHNGTISHAAISQNLGFFRESGSTRTLTITNAYSHLINALDDYGAGFTFTNRWGIYQAGTSDTNYFAANSLFGTTTNAGFRVDINGTARVSGNLRINSGSNLFWDNVLTAQNRVLFYDDGNSAARTGIGQNAAADLVNFCYNGKSIFFAMGNDATNVTTSNASAYFDGGRRLNLNYNLLIPTGTKILMNAGQYGAIYSAASIGMVIEPFDLAAVRPFIVYQNTGGSVGIGDNSAGVINSAQLFLNSTTKGFLPPRMTNAQRTAIVSPAVGLIVYCTDAVEGLYINKSTGWTFVI